MGNRAILFDDGAAYEQMMGVWSRSAGEVFLDWLAPSSDWRWIDIGCGSGAFTQLLVDRCAPATVQGIDPSEGQLAFARSRPASRIAQFQQGDALALPFADDTFDAAVMALVLVFVPDTAKGVGEMARVVRPGGAVAAYMWDMLGGGFPLDPILDEMLVLGFSPPRPPRMDASSIAAMGDLWTRAGLEAVETLDITVSRTFVDFDDFWTTAVTASSIASTVATLAAGDVDELKRRVRLRLPAEADGRITQYARAHAVKGRVPM